MYIMANWQEDKCGVGIFFGGLVAGDVFAELIHVGINKGNVLGFGTT